MTQLLQERETIVIDFPSQDEKVTSREYTFRISVPVEAEIVEVSIDGSPWQACRPAVGYFWYDWTNYLQGHHKVAARVHLRDGEQYVTAPHSFRVEFAKTGNSEERTAEGHGRKS